jgi:hypothetical protein
MYAYAKKVSRRIFEIQNLSQETAYWREPFFHYSNMILSDAMQILYNTKSNKSAKRIKINECRGVGIPDHNLGAEEQYPGSSNASQT